MPGPAPAHAAARCAWCPCGPGIPRCAGQGDPLVCRLARSAATARAGRPDARALAGIVIRSLDVAAPDIPPPPPPPEPTATSPLVGSPPVAGPGPEDAGTTDMTDAPGLGGPKTSRPYAAPLTFPPVAPREGGPAGPHPRKPWEYRVTATFAHLNTPRLAALVVELLRLQDEPPYILIVDTGSDGPHLAELEALRAADVEVHYLRGHAYRHSSEPVALACDVAMARCQADLLFFTHADCFPTSRSLIRDFAARCSADNPLVGYRMTDRSPEEIGRLIGVDPAGVTPQHSTREWAWAAGHSALMLHVPTAFRIGARWGMHWGRLMAVRPAAEVYQDTETDLNWAFRNAGFRADLIGGEENYRRNRTAHFDHVRSAGSLGVYPAIGDRAYRERVAGWLAAATADAEARIRSWRKLALWDGLDDAGRARAAACPEKMTRAGCCGGSFDACSRDGRFVQLADCAACVRAEFAPA